MEDVTDTAFRELILSISAPDTLQVVFTEFTSTDGLCHPKGRPNVEQRLKITETERSLLKKTDTKIVAQIWGNKPDKYAEAIRYIQENHDFDGIDINMGCPVKNVVKHGSCSALIDNEPLAARIIAAAREVTSLPLSIKTRLGTNNVDTERWIGFLLRQPLDAITIHGRTRKQMSEGEANWEEIGKAVAMRNSMAPHVSIIGNGDIVSVEDARRKISSHNTDGVMIGRGIFRNPWLFNPTQQQIMAEERIDTLLTHLRLFEAAWGTTRHYAILKRFFKIYATGFRGASDLRDKLMNTNSYEEARNVLKRFDINKINIENE